MSKRKLNEEGIEVSDNEEGTGAETGTQDTKVTAVEEDASAAAGGSDDVTGTVSTNALPYGGLWSGEEYTVPTETARLAQEAAAKADADRVKTEEAASAESTAAGMLPYCDLSSGEGLTTPDYTVPTGTNTGDDHVSNQLPTQGTEEGTKEEDGKGALSTGELLGGAVAAGGEGIHSTGNLNPFHDQESTGGGSTCPFSQIACTAVFAALLGVAFYVYQDSHH